MSSNTSSVDGAADDRPIAVRRQRRTPKPLVTGEPTGTGAAVQAALATPAAVIDSSDATVVHSPALATTEHVLPTKTGTAVQATQTTAIDSSDATVVDSPAGTIRKQVSPATTPRKKKRVRFSDPGLKAELLTSTGLTPALLRHRLVPSPRRFSHQVNRRRSLPTDLLSPPPYLPVVTVQFRPLREVIDARSKRRLKRNHLSAEVNDIEKEKRAGKKTSKESIATLKDQVEEKDRLFRALKREVVLWRTYSIAAGGC